MVRSTKNDNYWFQNARQMYVQEISMVQFLGINLTTKHGGAHQGTLSPNVSKVKDKSRPPAEDSQDVMSHLKAPKVAKMTSSSSSNDVSSVAKMMR